MSNTTVVLILIEFAKYTVIYLSIVNGLRDQKMNATATWYWNGTSEESRS